MDPFERLYEARYRVEMVCNATNALAFITRAVYEGDRSLSAVGALESAFETLSGAVDNLQMFFEENADADRLQRGEDIINTPLCKAACREES